MAGSEVSFRTMGRQKSKLELLQWAGEAAQEHPVVIRGSVWRNVFALCVFAALFVFLTKMVVFDVLPLAARGGLFIVSMLLFMGLLATFAGYCAYVLLLRCFNPPSLTLSPEGVSLKMDRKAKRFLWPEITSVEITRVDGPRGPTSWITFNDRKIFRSKGAPLGDWCIPDIWTVELEEIVEALESGRKRFSSLAHPRS
jgi:hypothetical protein